MYVPLFLLFLIASFGVGFMMNMVVKGFPWTSTVVAAALSGYFLLSLENTAMKAMVGAPVLVGGVVATLTIRTLQRRGFKMFG